MQKINHLSLLIKLSIGVVLTALAFIAFFIPAVTHAQTSAFAGAEIVILNQDTPFHYEPGTAPVRFVVDGGTLAEVLYFADPEIRDGQIWRKLRVADGFYGYVRESLISKYTGTIPTIWRGINFQPSQVHLNYEARKVNYNIVINQGVDYVTPPEGVTGGSDDTDEDVTEEEIEEDEDPASDTEEDDVTEEEDETEEEEIEEDETEEESLDDASTRALLVQLIKLLTQLLNMKLLNM